MSALQASLANLQSTVGQQPRRVGGRKAKASKPDSRIVRLPDPDSFASPAAREEWALVQQAIGGDSRAKAQIFTLRNTVLHRIAQSILRNKEDAEDAVQEALCRAYTRLQSFRGKSSFSTWLTRIVINSALIIRRQRNARPEFSFEEASYDKPERAPCRIVDARPNPEEICGTNEIHTIVAEEIYQLPPQLREALQLFHFDGLSIAESSQALGIRLSAFKSRVNRARRKLAKRLQPSLETPNRPSQAAAGSRLQESCSRRSRTNSSPVLAAVHAGN
jgi:RNA polymerase sigma-70 factor, ECF subfamily